MSCRRALLGSLLAALPAMAHAQNAPAALRGNTVVVTWVEDKNQRPVGAPEFRQERLRFSTSLYVNAEGQLLGLRFGNVDTGRSRDYGSNFSAQFRRRSLEVTAAVGSNAARRIAIDFNEGFNACKARVIEGKSAGAKLWQNRTMDGRLLEVRSLTISGSTCSVQKGNIFEQ